MKIEIYEIISKKKILILLALPIVFSCGGINVEENGNTAEKVSVNVSIEDYILKQAEASVLKHLQTKADLAHCDSHKKEVTTLSGNPMKRKINISDSIKSSSGIVSSNK